MANALYDPGREGFLDGTIDWDTGDIRAMLVLSTYTFVASHKFITDLGAVATIEAFGALDLQIVVADVGGIASDEAIGLPVVSPYVEPQPEPGFGGSARPWRASPAAIVGAGGIASAQAFGLPAVASGARSAARRRREARELGLPH